MVKLASFFLPVGGSDELCSRKVKESFPFERISEVMDKVKSFPLKISWAESNVTVRFSVPSGWRSYLFGCSNMRVPSLSSGSCTSCDSGNQRHPGHSDTMYFDRDQRCHLQGRK